MICVDSDIIIDHLRGREPGSAIFEEIVRAENPFTTTINHFELFCGVRSDKEIDTIKKCLLGFTVLPLNQKSSLEAARIYRELKKRGLLIGVRDIMIAGIATINKLKLATNNKKDFKKIKGLTLLL